MNIQTERLCIRNFKESDWQALYEYTADPMVMHYLPEDAFTEKEAQQFVQENQGENAEKFAVVLKATDELIGHIAFFRYFGEHTYEIGWVFNPKHYQKGYATEAAQAVIHYGFTECKLHRIIATCQPENTASWRIMEKIGMRKEGYFKKCIPTKDGWWDEYYYAILAEEYLSWFSGCLDIH